jgi:hypothetical protein
MKHRRSPSTTGTNGAVVFTIEDSTPMKWLIGSVLRRWLPTILGVVVVAPLLYFALAMTRPSQNRVSIVACQKVEIGMTEAEVKSLLGVPGEELTLLEKGLDCQFLTRWYGIGFQFFVSYDASHKVTNSGFHVRRPGQIGC